jgi:hypothetical protein
MVIVIHLMHFSTHFPISFTIHVITKGEHGWFIVEIYFRKKLTIEKFARGDSLTTNIIQLKFNIYICSNYMFCISFFRTQLNMFFMFLQIEFIRQYLII